MTGICGRCSRDVMETNLNLTMNGEPFTIPCPADEPKNVIKLASLFPCAHRGVHADVMVNAGIAPLKLTFSSVAPYGKMFCFTSAVTILQSLEVLLIWTTKR